MKFITAFIILSLSLLGCKNQNSKPSNESGSTLNNQPKVSVATESLVQLDNVLSNEGFINLPLNIVEQRHQDGYVLYTIQAMSKNDLLELIVGLKEGVPAGDGAPENKFLVDGIIFESTGPKSDQLLTTLAQKYQLNSGKLIMKDRQVFTCTNLNKTPVDYQSGTPKFKIFLKNRRETAELYINFDFKNSIISLNEKDPQYRTALINLLKE